MRLAHCYCWSIQSLPMCVDGLYTLGIRTGRACIKQYISQCEISMHHFVFQMEQATSKLLIHLDEVLRSKRIEQMVAKNYNRFVANANHTCVSGREESPLSPIGRERERPHCVATRVNSSKRCVLVLCIIIMIIFIIYVALGQVFIS